MYKLPKQQATIHATGQHLIITTRHKDWRPSRFYPSLPRSIFPDLPQSSKLLNFITYVDDTTLLSTVNPTIENNTQLNNELHKVYTWLCTNKLSLNITKTKTMTFHTPQRQLTLPALQINNIPIQNTDHFNFLGITLYRHAHELGSAHN